MKEIKNEKIKNDISTSFCIICGKSIPFGEKVCEEHINSQDLCISNNQTPVRSALKKRKPLEKKSKILIISLSIIFLIAIFAFTGFKLYQTFEQKRVDKITQIVENQILYLGNGEYSYVDNDGNVSAFEIYSNDKGNGYTVWIREYYLNSETGLLYDGDVTDDNTWILYETIDRYDYTKQHSILYLSNNKSVKVNLDENYNIISFEYDNIKYIKTKSDIAAKLDELYDYNIRLSDAYDNIDIYEEKLRNSIFFNSGFEVPMDDALDAFFKDYTITVEPDRSNDDIYYIYVRGSCYGYSYLYYATSGYTDYLDTQEVKFKYEYSVSTDEIDVVNDQVDGYSLRYLYVYASLYN